MANLSERLKTILYASNAGAVAPKAGDMFRDSQLDWVLPMVY